MGKIEGIKIQNYGVLKDIVLGKTRTNQNAKALGNLVAVIGPSGNGKSTLADAFGFIADCLGFLHREKFKLSRKFWLKHSAPPSKKPHSHMVRIYLHCFPQCEIGELIAAGHSNSEISQILFISGNMVKKHVNSLYRKLGITSRTQLLRMVYEKMSIAAALPEEPLDLDK